MTWQKHVKRWIKEAYNKSKFLGFKALEKTSIYKAFFKKETVEINAQGNFDQRVGSFNFLKHFDCLDNWPLL